MTGPDGTRARLDDVLGGRWLLLHGARDTPRPAWDRSGVPSLTVLPAGARPAPGAVVDDDGVLLPWLTEHRATTVALRPDAYVYAAAPSGGQLPPPPAGFTPARPPPREDRTMTTRTDLPAMQEYTIDVGGRHVFVAETGQGPPVLLLHGGGPGASGVANYTRNVAELAKEYRVIVPDLPGYGRSSKGLDLSDPFGSLAAGIRGLLDRLGLEKAHFVGNSYGGACALSLALDTPDRVERMVLMGPGGIGTTRALPTPGLNCLLDYYNGEGPTRAKLEKFIRHHLVFNAADVPDSVIDARYRDSLDPEVVADPPLRRPKSLGALWKMDFTRDRRLARLPVPTNDKELSYYARTPSGSEWEVGWNPVVIDETT